MRWFLDRSVGFKLQLAFLLVAGGSASAGVEAIFALRKMAAADQVLYNSMTVPLSALGSASKQFQRSRVTTMDVLFDAPTAEERAALEKTLSELTLDVDNTLAAFQATIVSPAMRKRYDDLQSARNAYAPVRDSVLALLRNGHRDEAVTLLNGELAARTKTVEMAFERVAGDKVGDASLLEAGNQKTAKWSIIGLVIFAFASVALAIGFGVWMARLIGVPLRTMATAAEHLAIGDLSPIAPVERKDEMGVLSVAFVQMIAAQQVLAKAASRLAAGDLSVRTAARCEQDVLGDAFTRLHDTLGALIAETSRLAAAGTAGHLDVRGNADAFAGGFHELVVGFNTTLDAVIHPVQEAAQVLQQLANRDLTVEVTGEYQGDHAQIKDAVNGAIGELRDALSSVVMASGQIAGAAEQIATSSEGLAQNASEQASSLEETTASLHELGSAADGNAAHATSARALAEQARAASASGVAEMQDLSNAVSEISNSAKETAQIMKTIDMISFQTNLLALNAAVEAARAGDAGRGFAVVAEEVRALAIRSADASRQTAALIEHSVASARRGAEITQRVSERLSEIDKHVEGVYGVIDQIAAASAGQREGVTQVNIAMQQMNEVTQTVAASAEESSSASEELAGQAKMLAAMVAEFTLGTETEFVEPLRRLQAA